MASSPFPAGLCLNCWSLQELVSRDPGHFLILLEQILQKTREVRTRLGFEGWHWVSLVESRNRSPQGFPGSSVVKSPPSDAGNVDSSLNREDPPEKKMATHACILAWESPWSEKSGRL